MTMRMPSIKPAAQLMGLALVVAMPIFSTASATEPLRKAELRERKRYCKILERQLRADVKIGGSGNVAVVGVGAKFELDYPNDLKDQYLAAHTDHAMACQQWRRGKISTDEYQKVRERWIAVYMAGTSEKDEERNKEVLASIIGTVSKFGFSDARKAELDREFEAIRNQIGEARRQDGDVGLAMLKAIAETQDRASSENKTVLARLDALELSIESHIAKPSKPSGAMPHFPCSGVFTIVFNKNVSVVDLTSPILAEAARCGRGGAREVAVTGYADAATGSSDDNMRLSSLRAASVAQALTRLGTPITYFAFAGGTLVLGDNPVSNRAVVIRVEPSEPRAEKP